MHLQSALYYCEFMSAADFRLLSLVNSQIVWNRCRKYVKACIFDWLIFFLPFFSAAWVHRGFSDDVTDVQTIQPGGDLLTDFQKDKFRYFFLHVLDLNSDYVISAEDFEKLNEVRMQKSECTHAQTLAVFLKYKERYFQFHL